MSEKRDQGGNARKQRLRQRAETLLSSEIVETESLDRASLQALIHELKVHQVELELQNEELRRTQVEIETARDRFSRLFHEAPVGYLTVDRAGIILQANRTFAQLVGTDVGALPQSVFASFLDARDRELYLSRFRSFFRHPEDKIIDVRLKDGNTFVRVTGRAGGLSLASDEPALLVIVADITDRKIAEQDLVKREREYRQLSAEFRGLLDAIPDTVSLLDPDLRYLWVNRAAADFLGDGDAGRVVGRRCYEIMGRQAPCEACSAVAAFEHSKPQLTEKVTDDGRVFVIRAAPIFEDEQVVSVIKVGREMTELKRLERLAERGRRMDSLGRLAGGIAHGFNNLLTGIVGNLSLAQIDYAHRSGNDGLEHILEEVQSAAGRVTELTQQLRALGSGQVMRLKPTALAPLIERVCADVATMADVGFSLELALGDDTLIIRADEAQLLRALYELMLFSPSAHNERSSGATVHLSTRLEQLEQRKVLYNREIGPGPVAVITVHHGWLRLSQRQRDHFFEPFYFATDSRARPAFDVTDSRARPAFDVTDSWARPAFDVTDSRARPAFDVTDSRARPAFDVTDSRARPAFDVTDSVWGLGLSVAYGVVGQHHGAIGVHSEPRGGTSFRVYLPLAEPQSTAEAKPALALARPGERLLVVEDDDLVRQLAATLLERAGYDVCQARNAAEALEHLKQDGPFDLMVTDVIMPDLSGTELAERAKKSAPDMRVLYVSGGSPEKLMSMGVPVLQDNFMAKPFTPRALATRVRDLLDKPQAF
jgi:PAS domain S-box-containing protein